MAIRKGLSKPSLFLFLAFFLPALALYLYISPRVGGDGHYYYLYLPSLLLDGDVDFSNQYERFGNIHNPQDTTTRTNPFPIGTAILWLPFFLFAHLLSLVSDLLGFSLAAPLSAHGGFAAFYQTVTLAGTVFYGALCLILTYDLLAKDFPRPTALLATLATACASSFLWYWIFDPSYSHVPSAFTVSLFLWSMQKFQPIHSTAKTAFILGVILGLTMLVRPQNALLGLLPIVYVGQYLCTANEAEDFKTRLYHGGLFLLTLVAGALLSFSPCMWSWKQMYGSFLTIPQGSAFLDFRNPFFLEVLFSTRHGLVPWNPLLGFALLGLVLTLWRGNKFWHASLILVLLAQIWVNAAAADWWAGYSFGMRRLMDWLPIFALGFATLITKLVSIVTSAPARFAYIVAYVGIVIFTTFNLSLMKTYWSDTFPRSDTVSALDLYANAAKKVYIRVGNPFSFPANWLFALRYKVSPALYDLIVGRYFLFGEHNYGDTLDFGSPRFEDFLKKGWSYPEHWESRFTFIWATRTEAEVFLPLREQRDYVFELRVAPFVFPNWPGQHLKMLVNGTLVGQAALTKEWGIYDFSVPRSCIRRGINVVTFRFDYAYSGQDLGLNNDPRRLSVAFDYLQIR